MKDKDLITLLERQQAISDYRDRRRQRLADRGYRPPESKFPRALLRQYGVIPGKDWTSSQAWAALGTAGVDAAAVYRQLRDKKTEAKK
jgi:hypothetical protein